MCLAYKTLWLIIIEALLPHANVCDQRCMYMSSVSVEEPTANVVWSNHLD